MQDSNYWAVVVSRNRGDCDEFGILRQVYQVLLEIGEKNGTVPRVGVVQPDDPF